LSTVLSLLGVEWLVIALSELERKILMSGVGVEASMVGYTGAVLGITFQVVDATKHAVARRSST